MANIEVEGFLLRKDYTELITEKFARRYSINMDNWIYPFGYYNQYQGSIICNGCIPDGVYILLGKIEYPGTDRYTYHRVCQFNALRSRGIDVDFILPFNSYPDLPKRIPLTPKFPLFRIGNLYQFNYLRQIFPTIADTWLTTDELIRTLAKLDKHTIEYKVYATKLALHRFAFKET